MKIRKRRATIRKNPKKSATIRKNLRKFAKIKEKTENLYDFLGFLGI